MKMTADNDLTRSDQEWLRSQQHAVHEMQAARRPRVLVRNRLLQEVRIRLRADYLFWGCGVHDPESHTAITCEFRDESDDVLVFDERGSADQRRNSLHARCAWVAHTLNAAPPTNRLISDIIRSTGCTQVTCDVHGLRSHSTWRTKLAMLMRPDLLLRARACGLEQFLLTLRRFGENGTFGIGYHRVRREDPLTGMAASSQPFSARDIALADAFSRLFDAILHRPRLDTAFLERVCKDRTLNHWERVAFPLLCSERYDEEDIAIILHMKAGRVSRLRRDIFRKLDLGSERRRSLQNIFDAGAVDDAWSDNPRTHPIGEVTDGRPSRWEPSFTADYVEPPLRERDRPRSAPPKAKRQDI
ncbi:MAG: hypothetical protein K8J09_03620 [Planctomycetes bacterium]|nr:hypothetical protein [Planctomycetota bacterium]